MTINTPSQTSYISLICRLHPLTTLFPYTTLFRSPSRWTTCRSRTGSCRRSSRRPDTKEKRQDGALGIQASGHRRRRHRRRSEEHTSELQSQSNLVCRLLLEKKKIENKQLTDVLYN